MIHQLSGYLSAHLVRTKSEPLIKKKEPAERIGVTKVRWISAVERGYCRYSELGYTEQLLFLGPRSDWVIFILCECEPATNYAAIVAGSRLGTALLLSCLSNTHYHISD